MAEDRFTAVAKGGIVDDRGGAVRSGRRWRLVFYGMGKKFFQTADAGDGRLDVLDFHADAFNRGKDKADIGDEATTVPTVMPKKSCRKELLTDKAIIRR